jgi:starvation-inducible DNA-binding protein
MADASGKSSLSLGATFKSFNPETGIAPDALDASAALMGQVLADTQMILQKTLGVHWAVAGPAFAGIHELTENQYRELFEAVDVIAERIRALGRPAPAAASQIASLTDLSEGKVEDMTVADMVGALVKDHEAICRLMRDNFEDCEERRDFVTADLLVHRMTAHEKAVWMLRATLAI